jgi:hypothetical protein
MILLVFLQTEIVHNPLLLYSFIGVSVVLDLFINFVPLFIARTASVV